MADGGEADATRGALLRAAHELMARDGAQALTVRRIATQAGVSTMNVYSRFGGKDGVIDELFADGFTRLESAVAAVPVTDDPVADLVACGHAYLAFARSSPAYYSLMFDRVLAEYRPGAAARAVAMATFHQLVGKVQRIIDHGALAMDDAELAAGAMWAQVHGLASLAANSRFTGDHDGAPGFDWEAIASVAVSAHVRGLCHPTVQPA